MLNQHKNTKGFKAIILATLFIALGFSESFAQYDLVVAQNGSGNYTTVQAAINAAPTGQTVPYKIFIKNGKYREKIAVPSTKPFIQLIGETVSNVIVYYDDPATILGTQNSASFSVNANDFSAFNITFANTFGDGSQAVAVLVNADRAAFKNCRFLGNQDTLYIKGSGVVRHYFRTCYIDGNVDFIFGSSVAIFDSCVIYAKARTSAGVSYITAANTPQGQAYGYAFKDCRLPANTGATNYYLGRPWQNSTGSSTPYANNKVVFINSKMSSSIRPEGWVTWDAGTDVGLITYAEFASKYNNGTAVDIAQRVSWSQQLNSTQGASYSIANMFSGWDPCTVYSGFCSSAAPDVAVSNFRVVKGASISTMDWNISWPINQLKFELFRSTTQYSGYAKISELTAANDTAINFQLTDPIPPSGSIYYYYLQASKVGYPTRISADTLQVSSAPTIIASGALSTFYQTIGTPSSSQIYTVSGTDLSSNITITPPVNFEVSTNGTTWYTNVSPLILTQTGGAVSSTTISVRLNATAAAIYSGNVTHTTTGGNPVNIAVNGNASSAPAIVSNAIQQWPLTLNNSDSSTVRTTGIAASTQTLKSLYVSNGTTVATVPAYSATYGQAYGVTSNGDGSWGTAFGGPGGNLNRTFYQQYTITALAGYSVRVDSILLASAFYNTSSNTKMALVYSKSNFVSDSTDVAGGTGPSGALAGTANGAFATPILLANQTGGTTNLYALNLTAAPGGVTLTAGQTLTIRLYNACGSGSAGRYAMVKNVMAKGQANTVFPLQLVAFTAVNDGFEVKANWNTINEINVQQFIVEKSNDGFNFISLGNILAKNNMANSYSFIDANTLIASAYYRLKMIDKDGSFSYSKVVKVDGRHKSNVVAYPNPAAATLVLTHDRAKASAVATIINVEGKKIASKKVVYNSIQTVFDISNLSNGIYWIEFIDGNDKEVIKFLKK